MACNCENFQLTLAARVEAILRANGFLLPDVTRPTAYQVRLYIYQELEGMAPVLYHTFITQDEARNMFGGKFAYRPLTSRDLTKGL